MSPALAGSASTVQSPRHFRVSHFTPLNFIPENIVSFSTDKSEPPTRARPRPRRHAVALAGRAATWPGRRLSLRRIAAVGGNILPHRVATQATHKYTRLRRAASITLSPKTLSTLRKHDPSTTIQHCMHQLRNALNRAGFTLLGTAASQAR